MPVALTELLNESAEVADAEMQSHVAPVTIVNHTSLSSY